MSEIDREYSCHVDGKWTNVLPLDDLVRGIKAHIRAVESCNERLAKENKELKDEHYRDKEICDLSKRLQEATQDLRRGFPISEEKNRKIQAWIQKHDEEVHGADYKNHKYRKSSSIGGAYKYEFVPTSIGTFGTVICSCGARFDFGEA